MSQLYNEFLLYRDKFGLNQLSHNNGQADVSQNGALFTLEYLICLMGDPNTSPSTKMMELERLREVYQQLEVFPGVSVRFPGSNEFDSMDNTGAIATFSGLYDHGNNTFANSIDQIDDPERNNKYHNLARAVSVIHCLTPVSLFKWIKSGFKVKMFWNNNRPDQFCLSG